MEELGRQIDRLSNELTDLRYELWTDYTVFTWQWWMLVGVSVLMLLLFVVLLRKDRLVHAFAFFGIVFMLNKYLDTLATSHDWYDYRIQIEPAVPTMLAANLFVIPMGLTLIYQRIPKWGAYLIGVTLFSALVAYVALPLMRIVDVYLPKAWNNHLSFLSLLVMSLIAKAFVDWASKPRHANPYSDRGLIRPLSFRREKAR